MMTTESTTQKYMDMFSVNEIASRSIGPSFLTKTGVRQGETTDLPEFVQRPVKDYDTSFSDALVKIALEAKAKRDARIASEVKTQAEIAVDRRVFETKILFGLIDMMFMQCVSILETVGGKLNASHEHDSRVSRISSGSSSVTAEMVGDASISVRFIGGAEEKVALWEPKADGYGSYEETIAQLRQISVTYAENTIRHLIDPA